MNPRNIICNMLASWYEESYQTEEYDLDTVFDFYYFLTEDLHLKKELEALGIMACGDLQEFMLHADI